MNTDYQRLPNDDHQSNYESAPSIFLGFSCRPEIACANLSAISSEGACPQRPSTMLIHGLPHSKLDRMPSHSCFPSERPSPCNRSMMSRSARLRCLAQVPLSVLAVSWKETVHLFLGHPTRRRCVTVILDLKHRDRSDKH